MNNIKAIIFDMDGVLIDAKEWHYSALNKSLNIFGLNISYNDHLTTYDGLPTSLKLEKLSNKYNFPRSLHKLINQIKQFYTVKLGNIYCKPNFLHVMTLDKLKKDGYKLIVASNSIPETINLFLTKANIIHYFDFILSNKDVEFPKPNPEIYIKAISNLELNPENCLILEDNENGIKAALASNAHLMRITSVYDVDYYKILEVINSL
jgi:beta-phosphoglucomutase-like phosphatase (HAD superfamily)